MYYKYQYFAKLSQSKENRNEIDHNLKLKKILAKFWNLGIINIMFIKSIIWQKLNIFRILFLITDHEIHAKGGRVAFVWSILALVDIETSLWSHSATGVTSWTLAIVRVFAPRQTSCHRVTFCKTITHSVLYRFLYNNNFIQYFDSF